MIRFSENRKGWVWEVQNFDLMISMIRDRRKSGYNSQTVKDGNVVTIMHEYEIIYGESNMAPLNLTLRDLERSNSKSLRF